MIKLDTIGFSEVSKEMDVCKIMKTRSPLHSGGGEKRMASKRMFQQNKFQAKVGAKQSIPIYQAFYSLENLFSLSVNLVKEDTLGILLFLVVSSCQKLDPGHLELVMAILRWDRSFF